MRLKSIQKYHIQQLRTIDTGIICLKSILNYFGIDEPLEKIRTLSGFYLKGVTLIGLVQAGRALGLQVRGYKGNLNFLQAHKKPCILQIIKEEKHSHFVVCYGYDENDEVFFIGDPEESKVEPYTKRRLQVLWVSKFLLSFDITIKIQSPVLHKTEMQKWILGLIKEDFNLFIAIIILGVGVAILNLSLPVFTQQLIDNIIPTENVRHLFFSILFFMVLLVTKSCLEYIYGFFVLRHGKDFSSRINLYFAEAMDNMPKIFLDNRRNEEILSDYKSLNYILTNITRFTKRTILNVVTLISAIIAIFIYDWEVGLLSLFSLSTFFVIYFFYYPKLFKLRRKEKELFLGLETTYSDFVLKKEISRPINSNNPNSSPINFMDNLYQKELFELKLLNIGQFFKVNIFNVFTIGIGLFLCIYQIQIGNLSLGSFSAILLLGYIESRAARELIVFSGYLQEARIVFEKLYDYLNAIPISQEKDFKKLKIQDFEELSVENLNFSYHPKKIILFEVSFKVRKGEMTVITGASGCGKTTLLNILQGYYNPISGLIKINNTNFNGISLTHWRKKIALIPEQITFIKGTVIQNILGGILLHDSKDLEDFLDKYGFAKYFKDFPGGYNTILGNNTNCLSRSQNYVVALARALWKKPCLLLLEDTFSCFDSKTRFVIINLLRKARLEMGIIIFTQNEILVEYADSSYRLENYNVAQSNVVLN